MSEDQALKELEEEQDVIATTSQPQATPAPQPQTASQPQATPAPQPQTAVPQAASAPQVASPGVSNPAPQAVSPGVSAEVVAGLAGQVEQVISVLSNQGADQLKLKRASGKLSEGLTWLKDHLRGGKPPAQE